jgi:acetyl-CoA decarbonylase/synthase complex subunit delta
MGFSLDRLVMYQTTGALGYGLEYTYSIQERGRLAALGSDRLMAVPVICLVGQEAWRAKEARATSEELPGWGDETQRGVYWETATATAFLHAGSDILVMRHPEAAMAIHNTIDRLTV